MESLQTHSRGIRREDSAPLQLWMLRPKPVAGQLPHMEFRPRNGQGYKF